MDMNPSLPLFSDLHANQRSLITFDNTHTEPVGSPNQSIVDELLSPIDLNEQANLKSKTVDPSQDAAPSRISTTYTNAILPLFNNTRTLLFAPAHDTTDRYHQPNFLNFNPLIAASQSNSGPKKSETITQPMENLPVEVVHRIFLHAMPPKPKLDLTTPWPFPQQGDPPLVLRRVCRAWKQTTFVQSLWPSVAWSVCIPTRPDSEARLAWITWFSQCINGPPMDHLSYEIGDAPLVPNSWKMMDVISGLITNCRAVRIVLPEWHAPHPDDIPTHLNRVVAVPHLRVLSWTSPHFIHTTLPVVWRLPWTKLTEAPWEQLTVLYLNCPLTLNDCIFVLKRCHELQTVEFNGVLEDIWAEDGHERASPFTHMLTSLKVVSSTNVNQMFDYVEFPNLDHLRLHLSFNVGRLQDLRLKWNQIRIIVLECPLDLVNAYQLFRQCYMVSRIEWHWPAEVEYPPRNELLRLCPLELSLLESLIITPSLPGYLVKPLVNLLVTQKTQKLQNLSSPFLPAKFQRFEYLVTLTLMSTSITVQECLSIVADSTALQHLDVIVGEGYAEKRAMVTSGLTSFTIRSMLRNLQPLLGYLILPSLTSLRLFSRPHEDGPPSSRGDIDWTGRRNYSNGPRQKGLLAFLIRSIPGDTLQSLTLEDIEIEETEMMHILQIVIDCKAETHIKADIFNHRMVIDTLSLNLVYSNRQ